MTLTFAPFSLVFQDNLRFGQDIFDSTIGSVFAPTIEIKSGQPLLNLSHDSLELEYKLSPVYASEDKNFYEWFIQNSSGLDLTNRSLRYAKLNKLNLPKTDFTNSDLFRANLNSSTFKNTNLSFTNLANATLDGSFIYDTYLISTNLSRAHLNGVQIRQSVLIDTSMSHVEANGLMISASRFNSDNTISNSFFLNLNSANLSGSIINLGADT